MREVKTVHIKWPPKLEAKLQPVRVDHKAYDRGYDLGYTEGETAAAAKAEEQNAATLEECNTALEKKGAETADSLEQVPQRIGQIESYADGYDAGVREGRADGYIAGETAATEAAEAANAVILADCNAVLPTKGASTAETLEQVPHRIEEIDYMPNPLLYAVKTNSLFQSVVFPTGYEIKVVVPNHQGIMENMFYGTKGLRKITLDVPTTIDCNLYGFVRESDVEEVVFTDGIRITSWNYFAYANRSIKRMIGRIDLSGSASNTVSIDNCQNLEEVYFMPSTVKTSLTIRNSPLLIDAAIQSAVDGFADMTGQTAITFTVHKTVGEKMTPTQKATLSAKNVTLAY